MGQEDGIWKLDDEFSKLEASPLGDSLFEGRHILGLLRYTPDRAADGETTIGAWAIRWRGIGLVMRLLYTRQVGGVPEATQHLGSLEGFAWEFTRDLQKACAPPAAILCSFVYEQDLSLADVQNDADIQAWTEEHDLRRIGERYVCYEPSTSLLRYIAGDIPRYHWCFVEPPEISALSPLPEVVATILLEAARALLHQHKIEVEKYASIARTRVANSDGYAPSTNSLHLIASLRLGHQEGMPPLANLAAEANDAAMDLTRILRSLEDIFLVFHEDAPWRSGDLTLQHIKYGRGKLWKLEASDIGSLTFVGYQRRSALRLEEYYRNRFTAVLHDIDRRVSYLQTASAIRNEQQTKSLNKLVLVLTVATVVLGVAQVMSANGWIQQNYWVLLAITLGLAIFSLLIVPYLANRWLKHSEAHKLK